MKLILFLLLATGIAATGAEDSWAKVKDLKSGAELRIHKKDARQPVLAAIDEANDERIIVVIKNEQVAIPKDEIDRIEYRPKGGGRVVKESKVATTHPGNPSPSQQRVGGGPPGPSQSSSSSLSFGSKPNFETIYRRIPSAPAK